MVIKKLINSIGNSLKLLGVGELTPYDESTLTPVSKKIGYRFLAVFFINLGCFA